MALSYPVLPCSDLSLVAEGIDRIDTCRTPGGIETRDHADENPDDDRDPEPDRSERESMERMQTAFEVRHPEEPTMHPSVVEQRDDEQ